MTFWGEWEADGLGHRIAAPGQGEPHWYLEPTPRQRRSYAGLQNTDPFVFGGPFFYSNCLQQGFPFLATLAEDDVILFGSRVDGYFALDTVFVIAEKHAYDPRRRAALPRTARRPSFEVAALGPLAAALQEPGCALSRFELMLFVGRTPTNPRPTDGAFSFAPARVARGAPESFLRPALFEYGKTQGAGVFNDPSASWPAVVNAVLAKGLVLGTAFDEPNVSVPDGNTAEAVDDGRRAC